MTCLTIYIYMYIHTICSHVSRRCLLAPMVMQRETKSLSWNPAESAVWHEQQRVLCASLHTSQNLILESSSHGKEFVVVK